MPAPTVAVTIRLSDGDGNAYADTVVTARLDQNDVYTAGEESFVIADPVTGTTDANGEVVLDLFPNHPTDGLGTTGSTWYFSARPAGSSGWHYAAQIPNTNCNLADLTNEPAPTNPQSFAASVRTVLLTGLSTATNAVAAASDTVLQAIGKLQAQITANLAATAATVRSTVLTGLSVATNAAVEATDSVLVAIGKLQAQITGLPSTDTATPTSSSTVLGETGGVVKRFDVTDLASLVPATLFSGVDSTGATSSSTGLSTALATGDDIALPSGTYKMSTGITVADNGPQRLVGVGDVTISVDLATSTDLFTINGPLSFENITFEFNEGPCRYALKYAESVGHIRLKNLKWQNLKDTDATTGSILVWIPPTGNTFDVDDIRLSSILKKGNGTITDAAGSLNCIYVGGGAGSTQGSIRNIYASDVHNIDAADAIIYEDTAVVYVITDSSDTDNLIRIENVQGNEFGKRLLKIHASNVTANGIVGYSTEGDSLGVIGFLSGDGQGDKYGCSATNCRAYGKMETAFSGSAFGVKWKNVRAYTTPGTKTGMSSASFGLLVNGDDTEVDGYESGSERHIGLGSSLKIIKNTKLRNLTLYFDATVALGLQNISSTLGFDGLTIDGVRAVVGSDFPAGVAMLATDLYLNGTTVKGRNLVVRDVRIESEGPANSYGLYFKYCENVSLDKYRYINSSGLTHYRLAMMENCVNVHVDDVMIEGANLVGVFLLDCTGRSTINRVQNPGATSAAVYNNNSTDLIVNNCDPAKVGGATTATPQNSKWTVGATADRPTTGLVVGFSQHFDTTLGKPVWLKSTGPSVWVDAAGTTV